MEIKKYRKKLRKITTLLRYQELIEEELKRTKNKTYEQIIKEHFGINEQN